MAKIFITGSADGLGLSSAQALASRGHAVTMHARNATRAAHARAACPQAQDVLVADLADASETRALATRLNQAGPWDAIVHNAGIMHPPSGSGAKDGLPPVCAVNTMAPYLLTCLVDPPPRRYVFLSSQNHAWGDASLRDVRGCSYSDSKLHNTLLAFWFARRWAAKGVLCNSLDPGWVPTKMGGAGAPDDRDAAVATYVTLAEGSGPAEGKTGLHWYQSREKAHNKAADDEGTQDRLVHILKDLSGVEPQ